MAVDKVSQVNAAEDVEGILAVVDAAAFAVGLAAGVDEGVFRCSEACALLWRHEQAVV